LGCVHAGSNQVFAKPRLANHDRRISEFCKRLGNFNKGLVVLQKHRARSFLMFERIICHLQDETFSEEAILQHLNIDSASTAMVRFSASCAYLLDLIESSTLSWIIMKATRHIFANGIGAPLNITMNFRISS